MAAAALWRGHAGYRAVLSGRAPGPAQAFCTLSKAMPCFPGAALQAVEKARRASFSAETGFACARARGMTFVKYPNKAK